MCTLCRVPVWDTCWDGLHTPEWTSSRLTSRQLKVQRGFSRELRSLRREQRSLPRELCGLMREQCSLAREQREQRAVPFLSAGTRSRRTSEEEDEEYARTSSL